MKVVDKVAIGVGISLSFILFSLLLFFLLRGKRRLRENLVKKNSTVSVDAEVNSFSKSQATEYSRPVYYINTSEIPSELSRENFISSHVKITCYVHT